MIEQSRRGFITGLLATSAVICSPAIIEAAIAASPQTAWESYFQKWTDDVVAVLSQCFEDRIIYGCSAWQETAIYPFIERIHPTMLAAPTERGGLWNLPNFPDGR